MPGPAGGTSLADPNQQYVPGFLVDEDGVPAIESEEEQYCTSKIIQCDGADTASTSSNDLNSTSLTIKNSQYSSQDEFDAAPIPAVLVPAAGLPSLGQQSTEHPTLMVDSTGLEVQPVSLPLFLVLNARSIYNKISNFKRFLREIAPSCVLVSESWEVVGRTPLETLLNSTHYKVISFKRGRGKPGGGAAIVYDDTKFTVEEVAHGVPEGIEVAWALLTPRQYDHHLQKIRRICVGSIYISPRSKHKLDTIEHLNHTVHSMRANYNNEVHFCFGGDLNRVDYSEVLESYGALQSVLQVPTRQGVKLEVLITDLHSWYHPPNTIGPLKVDSDKNGKDSDHLMAVFVPKTDNKFKVLRKKRRVTTRPLPETRIPAFCRDIQAQSWISVYEEENLDKKVENFHQIITSILNVHFPEKSITISSLEKSG